MKRTTKTKNYAAAWAPVLSDINAQIRSGKQIFRDTAFGRLQVTGVSWSEVTGCMFHAKGQSFCADLGWLESVSTAKFDRALL